MIETVLLAVVAALLMAWTLVAVVVGVATTRALGGLRGLIERAREVVDVIAAIAGVTRRQ